MNQQSARPEELPPLDLRKLRNLDVDEPSAPGRPAHLSAASGVVRRGDFVYVIGDDELHLGVFRLSSSEPGRLRRVLAGELPDDHGERSSRKPDLEALTVLPPFEGHPYGALLGLGSGSTPERDRGFVCGLAADGSLAGEPDELTLAPLYRLLREHVAELNVEGAATMGERLWLLHRGASQEGSNLVVELSLEPLLHSLRDDLCLDAKELEDVRRYDLGDIDGKVEGVHAAIDTGVLDFTFVCDQDDPEAPAPLLSATMPLEGRLEYIEG